MNDALPPPVPGTAVDAPPPGRRAGRRRARVVAAAVTATVAVVAGGAWLTGSGDGRAAAPGPTGPATSAGPAPTAPTPDMAPTTTTPAPSPTTTPTTTTPVGPPRPGWQRFDAPDGSFTAWLPSRPQVVDAATRPGAGAVFLAPTGSGAHRITVLPAPASADAATVEDVARSLAGAEDLVVSEAASSVVGGRVVVDLVAERADVRVRTRALLAGDRLYLLDTAEPPASERAAEHRAFVEAFTAG